VEKIPRAASDALIIGSTVHEVVASYLEHLIQHSLVTDWAWAEKQGFIDVPADVPEIWSRFYNNFILPPGMEAPAVEKKLAFTRAWEPTEFFAPDAYFRLVVDLTYRQGSLAVITDWKSGRIVPETVEKDLQLRIYGWGVQQALYPDAQEILLRLHFLRYGAEREILLLPEDLGTVPQELEAKIAVIEAEKHFDPKPGSFCGWCGVTAHCPVMAQALVPVEILAPATKEQAAKAATLLLAIRAMDTELTARLKSWVKEFGPVVVGDSVYGPSVSTSYDLDAQEVTDKLLGDGLAPEQVWPLLNVTKTSLERGLKKLKRKDLLEELLSAAPSKQTEKVGFSKVREGR